MPGTRTAPTVDGSITGQRVSFRLIDSRGDRRSVSARSLTAVTDADVEALAVALQAATNASLYSVTITDLYEGLALGSNAVEAVVESVYDNVSINFKDVPGDRQQTMFIPAPLGDYILDGDVVDTADTVYTAVRDAFDTVLGGNYDAVTVTFTERRDKNDKVPATA